MVNQRKSFLKEMDFKSCDIFSEFLLTGSLAKWAGTIPDDFSGIHHGIIQGEYTPEGKGEGKEPKIYTWQVDTHATVPTVKITKCPEKMLVEGTFELEAKAEPEIEGQKYNWSFDGKREKDFEPNPSEDGKTKFNPKEITSPASESFIKVKYGDLDDKKEVKITRCEYFKELDEKIDSRIKKIDANLYEAVNPYKFERTRPKEKLVFFEASFAYELYDQYRKPLIESEQGDAIPYVKERRVRNYSLFSFPSIQITEDWQDLEDCKMDGKSVDYIYFWSSFLYLKDENKVRSGAIAISQDIYWLASVEEGLHEKSTLHHWLVSEFIDVERDDNNVLDSFRIKTYYFRTGAFIKK